MSVFNEALEWLDRAEHAREVAGLLSDPGAKRAMLQAAKGYEHLARTATARAQKCDYASGSLSDPLGLTAPTLRLATDYATRSSLNRAST